MPISSTRRRDNSVHANGRIALSFHQLAQPLANKVGPTLTRLALPWADGQFAPGYECFIHFLTPNLIDSYISTKRNFCFFCVGKSSFFYRSYIFCLLMKKLKTLFLKSKTMLDMNQLVFYI